nr:helix-turn-helix domain-containing protein [Rathayibacter sp. VKM Ac-2835]
MQALRRLPVDELPEYLRRPELAAYTGVAVQTLARWATEGTGPKITHLGRHVRYKRAHVKSWLRDSELASTAEAS